MKNQIRACLIALLISASDLSPAISARASPVQMVPIPRAKLCVTEGAVEALEGSRLAVTVPKMRAFVAAVTPQAVEVRFTYVGPTRAAARLGSGQIRRQFGLKLRAQDGCNLVYAMWRMEPESKLVVSAKTNPGLHASRDCGNRGYRNIKPRRSSPVPHLSPGDSHALGADMNGDEVRVSVDGSVVWEGSVGPEARSFDGPVGMRTDNVRLEFELLSRSIGAPISCRLEDEGD